MLLLLQSLNKLPGKNERTVKVLRKKSLRNCLIIRINNINNNEVIYEKTANIVSKHNIIENRNIKEF